MDTLVVYADVYEHEHDENIIKENHGIAYDAQQKAVHAMRKGRYWHSDLLRLANNLQCLTNPITV